jgi:nucleotide-binding universal stress UspA family protein
MPDVMKPQAGHESAEGSSAMIKTILVPASGSEKDLVVFGTALKAAQIHHAHLAFYHLRPAVGEALVHEPHTGFALGNALRNLLDDLGEVQNRRSLLAERHVRDFCARSRISLTDSDTPVAVEAVTASWRGSDFGNEYRLVAKARSHDLVVMGRFTEPNGLPTDLLQLMLIECGRPILVAADKVPQNLAGTVMVCWKDAPGPARAVSVAMPILANADRVVVVAVDEGDKAAADSATAIVQQLAWHRVRATAEVIAASGRSVQQALLAAAQKLGADLVVMGAYSKKPLQETIFGGCTDSMLTQAPLPVLMVH